MSKNLQNQVELVANSLSINTIKIVAPQNVSYTWTLPNTVGSSGQFLTTNGTGVLSWTDTPIVSGVLTVGGVVDNSLTASQAVFTNASKRLVSVATTGTGSAVLSSTPTLVTPNIGAATGTSLVTTGDITSNGAGVKALGTTNPAITVRVAGNELGCATSVGAFSTNSAIGDLILRAQNNLHFLSGSATSPLTITTTNTVRTNLLNASSVVLTNANKDLTTPANGTNGQVLSVVGGVPAWGNPSVPPILGATLVYYATASQNIPASGNTIFLTPTKNTTLSTTQDPGITHNTGTGLWTNDTTPKVVLVNCTVSSNFTGGGILTANLQLNNVNVAASSFSSGVGSTFGFNFSHSFVLRLGASDTFRYRIDNNTGSIQPTTTGQNWWNQVEVAVIGVTS